MKPCSHCRQEGQALKDSGVCLDHVACNLVAKGGPDMLKVVRLIDAHSFCQAGDVGTIVEVFNQGTAFEVEFADENGCTIEMLTLKREEVEIIDDPCKK